MAARSRTKADQVEIIADERRSMEDEFVKTSGIYAQQVKMMREVYGKPTRKGGLDPLTKIMLGVGMAVHSGSQSAIEWTITRALNHGGTTQQILDAIDVALLNGGTFSVANARFAYRALKIRKKNPRKSE